MEIKDKITEQNTLESKIQETKEEINKIMNSPSFVKNLILKKLMKNKKLLKNLTKKSEFYQRYQFIPKKIKKFRSFKKFVREDSKAKLTK